MGRSARDVMDAYFDGMNRGDWDLVRALLHDDYVEDYPQSGERIIGPDNAIAIRRFYPRLDTVSAPASALELSVGGEDHWAMAPNFTAIRVNTDGDTITSLVRGQYPDGPWYIVHIATVESGRVRRATMIFGPLFDPPEWRRQWAGRMPDRER